MAESIADGIRDSGNDAETRKISDIRSGAELEGFDGYFFGAPTYFKDTTEEMKTFLFLAQKADLKGKVGGAFGSYTHIGNGPKMIYDTLEHVFHMNMGDTGPLNVKEQILDSGKGEQPCREFGKALGQKLDT